MFKNKKWKIFQVYKQVRMTFHDDSLQTQRNTKSKQLHVPRVSFEAYLSNWIIVRVHQDKQLLTHLQWCIFLLTVYGVIKIQRTFHWKMFPFVDGNAGSIMIKDLFTWLKVVTLQSLIIRDW